MLKCISHHAKHIHRYYTRYSYKYYMQLAKGGNHCAEFALEITRVACYFLLVVSDLNTRLNNNNNYNSSLEGKRLLVFCS